MRENLFVYGTLKFADVQKRIIGRLVETVPEVLKGYKIEILVIGINEYFTLVRDDLSEIEGAMITVTKDELNRIDDYEPEEYERISVTKASGKTAWVYVKA